MKWRTVALACAVLCCTSLVLADGQNTMKTAIMDSAGQLLPQATMTVCTENGEPVRAVPVGDGTWYVSGVEEKAILHLKDPVHGNASVEFQAPAAQAQVAIYWGDKTVETKIISTLPEPSAEGLRAFPAIKPGYTVGAAREDCPAGTLFGQTPHGPDDSWSFGTADVNVNGANLLRAESFTDGGEICDIHWWGTQLWLDPVLGWLVCTDSDPVFEIKFYADAGGAPGAEVCSYTVTPTITDLGTLYAGFAPLLYYSVDVLDPCCIITDGWVSIQGLGDADCWFLWLSSPDGDGSSYFNNDGTPEAYLYDNSMCLTGQYVPTFGACCDDSTATCNDGIEMQHCAPPLRFAADTLCADLDPPCGEVTTCDHTIVLTDDFGDGWNGGMVDVLVNGVVVLDNVTLATGAGPMTYVFPAATDDAISTVYVAGSWAYENEYHIYDVNGTQICADGTGGTQPTGGACGLGNCGGDPCAGNEPPNDDCVTATPVAGPYPQTVNGTNYCAQIDCPGVLDWNATWWAIDLPYALNNLNVSFCPNAYEINNVGVVYYNDCTDCAAYILYDMIDWYGCPSGLTSPSIDWLEIPGPGTVYFPVYFNDGAQVDYTIDINVTEVVVPENDLCADAIAVAVPSTTAGTTQGASTDAYPTCGTAGVPTSPGVWYSVTGTGNGMTASLCSGATTWDTKLTVYCPDCVDTICVDGNDDACGVQSEVSWCSQYGANYLILVHGYGGATGPFELDVFEDGVPCQADVACLPEGACCLLTGECIITNELACDAAGGEYQGDDTNCLGLPTPDATITVEILTDNYGGETSWDLFDEDSNVVASGSSLAGNTFYSWDVPALSCGCYTFTIYDSYGDGICCSYGYGYYNVYYDGALVGTGGDFGDDESVTDIGDCTGCAGGVGACCLPDNSCVVTTPECCDFAGGVYVGAGSNCGTGTEVRLSEDFNGGIPGDWTVVDDDGSGLMWNTNVFWGDANWTGSDGMCAEASSDNTGSASYDTSLITRCVDLSGAISATLDLEANYQNFAAYDWFYIDARQDGGAWMNLLAWNEDHGTFHGAPGEHITVAVPVGSACTEIRFRYYDPVVHYNWEIQIDDVVVTAEVEGLSPCQNMDIKPGSCPNSFNRKSHGVLPVALVGTEDFDVTMVDIASITLERADGIGGAVAPHEGPPGPHSVFNDAATPFDGIPCACHELCGDGITDLSMKFKSDNVTADLELGDLDPGALVLLILRGTLMDGTPFVAEDCIRLVPPGTPPGQIRVRARHMIGAWVDVSPADETLDEGGFCDFARTYPIDSVVTLTAPLTQLGAVFDGWYVDGVKLTPVNPVLQVTVTEDVQLYKARYLLTQLKPAPLPPATRR